jgi:Protein of unknown function (DUF742)
MSESAEVRASQLAPRDGQARWLDSEAGPVVRPYALTRGRTRSAGTALGVIDQLVVVGAAVPDSRGLGPEHRRLLGLCRAPMAVADLAADTDLPLGVVRVLLGDLLERGAIALVGPPEQRNQAETVLRNVLDGLRAL